MFKRKILLIIIIIFGFTLTSCIGAKPKHSFEEIIEILNENGIEYEGFMNKIYQSYSHLEYKPLYAIKSPANIYIDSIFIIMEFESNEHLNSFYKYFITENSREVKIYTIIKDKVFLYFIHNETKLNLYEIFKFKRPI